MRKFLLLVALSLCFGSAKADTFRLSINSAAYNDGHFGVGFYNSTLLINENLALPLQTVCIDFGHNVAFNQPFAVTIVNLHVFDGALHDNYWMAGWISLQMQNTTDLATLSDQQRAIWLITTPGTSDPYLTTLGSFTWANQAALNYHSVSDSNFVLYLRSGEAGQSQLSVVPEPATYAYLCAGLISLVGFRRLFARP